MEREYRMVCISETYDTDTCLLSGVVYRNLPYPLPSDTESCEYPVICISGSMRYTEMMTNVASWLERFGWIVLMPHPCGILRRFEYNMSASELDEYLLQHHFKKIDMADLLFVVNYKGYIGESTRKEIEYAKSVRTPIIYLEDPV